MKFLTKREGTFLLLLNLLWTFPSYSQDQKVSKSKVSNIVSKSEIKDDDQGVTHIKYTGSVLHSLNCNEAMAILSDYETLAHYLYLIDEVDHDATSKVMTVKGGERLAKLTGFELKFSTPKIESPGVYNVELLNTLFKGFKSNLVISDKGGKCGFDVTGNWSGKLPGMNNDILMLFSDTFGELVMKRLVNLIPSKIEAERNQ